MIRSIDSGWDEDEVIFLPNSSDHTYHIDIVHNGTKKRVYIDDDLNVGPLFLKALEEIRAVLLDGTIVFELEPGNVITFTIVNGKYHSINDKPSFSWTTTNQKTILKWHNNGELVKTEP